MHIMIISISIKVNKPVTYLEIVVTKMVKLETTRTTEGFVFHIQLFPKKHNE